METAEFDRFADEYNQAHEKNIAITGEKPEFFHEYKIKVLDRMVRERNLQPRNILDFGSGIGNSTPFLRRYFSRAQLTCADVSKRSLEIAASRFPGMAIQLPIQDQQIPVANDTFAISFSACVFHHIPHEEHIHWLRELLRVTSPGGVLAVFEHNPLNPLTIRAVNSCPFDENARLIRAKHLLESYHDSGWRDATAQYHVFFPHALAGLRVLEPHLSALPLGGQYSVVGIKPL
jgi:SAM-dependent methyltransferase